MRERADRRLAAVVGVLLAVASLVGDLSLMPPGFVEDGVRRVSDSINGRDPSPSTTRPGDGGVPATP